MKRDRMKTKIDPIKTEDGKLITPTPPSGGSWTVDAGGALVPRDKATAEGAGLTWPDPAPATVPAPAAPAKK